ncbi:hypothetical protein B296_00046182 [Ensete ventricosum]|uniref:Uncharacterized protein n=1 Tax=Ensete ventricosum TaxID=4639 RepID=A0A426YT51_ENSVE|nr:hypothetical protein B296_00046182 [Ensete ventricosum]
MWSRGGSTRDHLRCVEEDLVGSWATRSCRTTVGCSSYSRSSEEMAMVAYSTQCIGGELEIRGEVKARQPYSYGGNFLRENPKRTRVAPRLAMLKPSAPSTTIRAPAPKKLIRDDFVNDWPRGCVGTMMNHGAENIAAKRVGFS